MAGGNISPRQKMINMMYLVLTAMLAMNVSKDILEALSKLDEGMTHTIETVSKGNENIYSALEAASKDDSKKARALPLYEKSKLVKAKSDELFNYVGGIKKDLIDLTGGIEDGHMKGSDNRDVPQNYILNPKEVGGKDAGKEMKKRINEFKEFLKQQDPDLAAEVEGTFNVEDQKNKDGVKTSWEVATFSELPLAGIVPFLTDIQARVRRLEASTIEKLYSNIDATTIKFTAVRPVVMPKSTYVTQGGTYEADVFLAAYDDSNDPEFLLNGNPVSDAQVSGGVAKITMRAEGIGEKKFGGVIRLNNGGDIKDIPYDLVYTVAPPTVVISPTKMNVLYRNVENPLEISVPGVEPSKLRVSGPGVSGSNGNYTADVTRISGKEVTINVSVVEADGTTKPAGNKVFRIKGLPQAQGMIYKQSSGLRSASALAAAPVEAQFVDFAFDLPLTVKSFEVKMDGQPPIKVNGNTFDSSTRNLIQRLKTGSSVTIRKIKAATPKGDIIDNIGNISIDIQ